MEVTNNFNLKFYSQQKRQYLSETKSLKSLYYHPALVSGSIYVVILSYKR